MAHLPHINFEPASVTQERDGVGDIACVGGNAEAARDATRLRVPVGIMPSAVVMTTGLGTRDGRDARVS